MGQVAQQIAFADRILLNKIDLVDAQHLAQVERRIRFSSPEFCFPLRILYSLENTESLEIR